MPQDLEEWAHLQYFGREVDTPTFLIGPIYMIKTAESTKAEPMIKSADNLRTLRRC